jgi:alkylated DNA nucleotide flippase Atl1
VPSSVTHHHRAVLIMSWDAAKEPSPDFVENVLRIVNAIPAGLVMTYGDVAAELKAHADLADADAAYGAWLVGQVMARFGSDVPWWRVIRASGQPPKYHEEQAWTLYVAEETPLTGPRENYRIDLAHARFRPGADSSRQASLDLF